jgi:acyl-CoA synthetase (AMP-forming)/AMP-acid ligase II
MTSSSPTLVEALRARAVLSPDAPACTFLGDRVASTLSYGELDARARAVAACLEEHLAAGDRAILLHPPGLPFVAAFFGCLYAGVVPVPVSASRTSRAVHHVARVVRSSGARAVLTGPDGGLLSDLGLCCLVVGASSDGAEAFRAPRRSPDGIAFLQFTSGSTTEPKGVVVGHDNLVHNLEQIHRAFGHGPGSVGVNWLPLHHDMGLIGTVLEPVYHGFHTVLMSPLRFVQRPVSWLEAIGRYGATTAGGPNFAYALCLEKVGDDAIAALDLTRWQVAFCGAEPISANVLLRFADRFARAGFQRGAFFPCYGLAEATLFVTGARRPEGPLVRAVDRGALEKGGTCRRLVSSGRPWGDTEVAIVDPVEHVRCPSGTVGEIWVAGASVNRGYWALDDLSSAVFGARLEDAPERRFLRTGDLGFIEEGELYVTGRIKDLLVVDGRNVYPEDVEQCIGATTFGASAAFAIEGDARERVAVVHEVEPGSQHGPAAAAILGLVAAELGVRVDVLVLVKPRSIPRTSSGKVARSACREAYLQGRLPIVGVWPPRATEVTA